MKKYITKKTSIAEAVERYPELGEVLEEDYGFHCVGCEAAAMETIEDGAMVHGMSAKQTDLLVEKLNEFISKSKSR